MIIKKLFVIVNNKSKCKLKRDEKGDNLVEI